MVHFHYQFLGTFLVNFIDVKNCIMNNFYSDFAASRINSFEHMMNWSKIYGPVYTFWMSSNPIVVITDLKIANEGFSAKRNDLAGRPQIEFCMLKFKC